MSLPQCCFASPPSLQRNRPAATVSPHPPQRSLRSPHLRPGRSRQPCPAPLSPSLLSPPLPDGLGGLARRRHVCMKSGLVIPGFTPGFTLLITALEQVRWQDQAWLNQVIGNPILALIVALLLLRLVPAIINTFLKWVATPTIVVLLLLAIASHPDQLLAFIGAVQSFVAAQPEVSSRVVLLVTVVALAPYILMVIGALAAADILLSFVVPR